jgi:hypothetical protein
MEHIKTIRYIGRVAFLWIIIFQIGIGLALLPAAEAAQRKAVKRMGAGPKRGKPASRTTKTRNTSKPAETAPAIEEASELTPEQVQFEKAAADIENSKEGEFPGPSSKDEFLLTKQYLEVADGEGFKKYELTRFDLPLIVAGDFETDVEIEVNRQNRTIAFAYKRKGKVSARHVIEEVDVVSFSRDKELLTFLENSGKIRSIDTGFAKDTVFKAPLPVFEVADLGKVRSPGDILTSYLTRGLEPMAIADNAVVPLDIPNDPFHTAGDFVVYENNGGNKKILGIFDRNVMRTRVYTGEAVLATLAAMQSPSTTSPMAEIAAFQSVPEIRETTQQAATGIDPLFASILNDLPPEIKASLAQRAMVNHVSPHFKRDRFSQDEWESSFSNLLNQAEKQIPGADDPNTLIENRRKRDLGDNWQELLESQVHPEVKKTFWQRTTAKSLKIMASVIKTGTFALVLGGAAWGADALLFGGTHTAWVIKTVNEIYGAYMPAVLKDKVYRITLLKGSTMLMSFVPLLVALGAGVSAVTGKGWGAFKTTASLGMRVYSAISLPFFHYIARVADQPNFIRAMQKGINPLKAGGRWFPGLNSPLRTENAKKQIESNARALQEVAHKRARTKSMAWALAVMVVAENAGYDAAYLSMLAENGGMGSQTLDKLTSDPTFVKKWNQVAYELEYSLLKMKTIEGKNDLKELSKDELLEAFSRARDVARRVENRGPVKNAMAQLRVKFRQMTHAIAPTIANFGVKESEFLKHAEPNNFVVTSWWRQFWVDYILGVGQVGLFGPRADMSKPHELAAAENGILGLYTTPGHRADMFDQVFRAYGVQLPAEMAMVYQLKSTPVETKYKPIEEIILKSEPQMESFGKTSWNWLKGASNIPEAKYGEYWLKTFVKSIKTVQSLFILSMIGRVFLGGQAWLEAIPAFAYVLVATPWAYRNLWPVLNRGNQVNEDRMEARAKAFLDAKVRLGQGLRLDDNAEILKGYKDLAELYRESPTKLPESIDSLIPQMEEFLSLDSAADLNNLQEKGAETMKQVKEKGLTLLDFSVGNPPFTTVSNKRFDKVMTLGFAVATTYLGTKLFVDSFRSPGTLAGWAVKLVDASLFSGAMFAITYFGQKMITRWVENHKKTWSPDWQTRRLITPQAPDGFGCNKALGF